MTIDQIAELIEYYRTWSDEDIQARYQDTKADSLASKLILDEMIFRAKRKLDDKAIQENYIMGRG